jgi:hypothetical protein
MRGPAWKGFMPETASNRVESRNERRKRKYLQNINYLCNNASQKNSYRFFFWGEGCYLILSSVDLSCILPVIPKRFLTRAD